MQQRRRQADILRKMGVLVWKIRADEAAATATDMPQPPESGQIDSVDSANPAEQAPPASVESVGLAEHVQTLASIEREVSACRKCELHRSRTHTVFGCGDPKADWLFIGEAPGRNEDLQGQPFVGRAGQLLDKMIAALGMRREQVFIANMLKCRPPDNRDPLPAEVEQCEPYLHRQLAIIRPKVIVALGRISAQALLKTTAPLGKLRGKTHHYGPDAIPLVATYHPAYLLRSPRQKAAAWDDLWQARLIARPPQ